MMDDDVCIEKLLVNFKPCFYFLSFIKYTITLAKPILTFFQELGTLKRGFVIILRSYKINILRKVILFIKRFESVLLS